MENTDAAIRDDWYWILTNILQLILNINLTLHARDLPFSPKR